MRNRVEVVLQVRVDYPEMARLQMPVHFTQPECVNDFETPASINLVSKSGRWFFQRLPFSVG